MGTYLRKCTENHAIFHKYKCQKHCMIKVIFAKVPSQNKETKVRNQKEITSKQGLRDKCRMQKYVKMQKQDQTL